ncbi:MAG: YihY/virulence factor BrkB family protein, partial [Acidimicrobiales bacterium]
LVLLTMLSSVGAGARTRVLNSVASQFPVIGDQLGLRDIRALPGNGAGLVLGVVGLLWGSLGVTQASQHAMAEIWNVPGKDRPSFWVRLLRGIALLGLLGLAAIATTVLAGLATFGGRGAPSALLGAGASLVANAVLFLLAFRLLTTAPVSIRALAPGAVVAGVGWSALQIFGTFLLGHQLNHSRAIYGFFGVVLGLISVLYLGAQLTLYAAELNVVRAAHLWPRSLVQPPLTPPDREALRRMAVQEERRPEERVVVRFDGEPGGPEQPKVSPEGPSASPG